MSQTSARRTSSLISWTILTAVCATLLSPEPLLAARYRYARKTSQRAAEPIAQASPLPQIEVERVEGTTLHFRATGGLEVPAPLKTDLQNPKFLGMLTPTSGGAPYFFVASREPAPQIQVYRPKNPGRFTSFVYPGRIYDPKTRASLIESRAFIGRCLRNSPSQVYVVFQRERVDRKNRMQTSVFIAEAAADHLEERLIERNLPRLEDTLRLVRARACRELERLERPMLNKPLDLTPRRGIENNEDETDEDRDDVDEKNNEPVAPDSQSKPNAASGSSGFRSGVLYGIFTLDRRTGFPRRV